jgi:crotonobetaine/carnitine-CoA ligase
MMAGYLGMPDKTVQAWRNLWFHTGDVGYVDGEGWFHFVDRLGDRIRRRAENISSYEIESAAALHPIVLECAAVGVPSGFESDDDIKLFVVPRPGEPRSARMLEHLVRLLPHYMVPRQTIAVCRAHQQGDESTATAVGECWDRKAAGLLLDVALRAGTHAAPSPSGPDMSSRRRYDPAEGTYPAPRRWPAAEQQRRDASRGLNTGGFIAATAARRSAPTTSSSGASTGSTPPTFVSTGNQRRPRRDGGGARSTSTSTPARPSMACWHLVRQDARVERSADANTADFADRRARARGRRPRRERRRERGSRAPTQVGGIRSCTRRTCKRSSTRPAQDRDESLHGCWIAKPRPTSSRPAAGPRRRAGAGAAAADRRAAGRPASHNEPQEMESPARAQAAGAVAYAANGINRILDAPNARVGIISAGKSWGDARRARVSVSTTSPRQRRDPLLKIGMTWPLDAEIWRGSRTGRAHPRRRGEDPRLEGR